MNPFSIIKGGKRIRFNKINLDPNIATPYIPAISPQTIYKMGKNSKGKMKMNNHDVIQNTIIETNITETPTTKTHEYLIQCPEFEINIPTTINNELVKITFIIPTIGRNTLKDTVRSLQYQTSDNWYAIIIFDGIDPTIDYDDPRILFLTCDKLGEGPNYAGRVRNYGMTFVNTEWIAFLDDDDSIASTYVETFYNEIQTNCIDVILFRMHFNNEILPNLETDDFYKSKVGISFAIKKTIVDSGNVFSCSEYEDYEYLSLLKSKNYSIMISPHVIYFVRDYNVCCNKTGNRLFLNEKNTAIDTSIDQIIEETPLGMDISINQIIKENAIAMDISLNQIIKENAIAMDISLNQIIKENTIAMNMDILLSQIIKENTVPFDQIIKGNIDTMNVDCSMNLVIKENNVIGHNYIMPQPLSEQYYFYKKYKRIKI